MGRLVRSEKVRQSCTNPGTARGGGFQAVRATALDDALLLRNAEGRLTLPTVWGKGRMRRTAQSLMVRGIIAKETLW
jgi:hypothetical protein